LGLTKRGWVIRLKARKMANQLILSYYLNETNTILGEVINTAAMIRGGLASQPDANQKLLADLDQLVRVVSEIQVTLTDYLILIDPQWAELRPKIKEKSFSQTKENLAKVMTVLKQHLPQREVPVLPRGNHLALLLYKTYNRLVIIDFFWQEEEIEGGEALKKATQELLGHLTQFFSILFRWANLLLNQKEHLWVEPGKKAPSPTNQLNPTPPAASSPANQPPIGREK